MKRKFLSFLMVLGAFAIASTSLTSCKDYDDDIQDLQKQITTNLNALNDAKADLQGKINTLQGRIETTEGQIKTIQGQISDLRTDVDANADKIKTLEGNLVTLAGRVSGLEARMQAAEDALKEINGLITDLQNNKLDKSEFNEKVTEIYAKFESIEEDLGKHLKRIEGLEKGLEDEITARKAAVLDLQQQIDAVKKFEARIKAIEDDYLKAADKQELEGKITALKTELTTAMNKMKEELTDAIAKAKREAISDSKTYTDQEINKLKKQLDELSKKVDALQAEVNVLNVLVKNSLRSLVFVPDGYYHGIEATSFNYLEAYTFKNVPAAAWNKKETRGYLNEQKEASIDLAAAAARTVHNRYDSTKVALVEDLWAKYHLNPSNVNTDHFTSVDVLSGDKWFENTRSATKADAGLSVKSWKVADGILNVQLNVKDPEQIKAVSEDYWAEGQDKPMVTVFASQVTLNKAGKDTTVTSDYATLFADKLTDLRLAHIDNNAHATGQANTHCGVCALANVSHVMATVHEAASIAKAHQDNDAKTNAQDKVHYKETLDLRTLVATHWTSVDGTHKKMTADELKKFGLTYKFELTSLILGNNNTDESAHAAILEDGYTFRPQLPRKNGTNYSQVDPKATDIADFIGDNALQAVGRTPMVRVSLVDADGKVYDYGYIRIEITGGTPPPARDPLVVTYDGTGRTYQDVCPSLRPTGYDVYATKWIQTEYDIYKGLGVDRPTFVEHFEETPVLDGQNEVQQWVKTGNSTGYDRDGWEPLDIDKYVGVLTYEPDMDSETGVKTSILKWQLTANDIQKLYLQWTRETQKKTEKTYELKVAAKYTDKHGAYSDYKNVYVEFTTKVTFKPYSITDLNVKVDWSAAKIAKFWYLKNTAEMGTDELHTNVPSVEDELRDDADSLTNLFSNEFLDNKVVSRNIVTGGTGFNYNNYKYRLVFDESNKGKQFKGASGSTYTLSVSADGRQLLVGNTLIAELVLPAKFADKAGDIEEANYTMIKYAHSKIAHDLLNYCSHKEFDNKNDEVLKNFLNVVISLAIQNDNQCAPIKVENGSFNVRFLRPIDVTDGNSNIQDAGADGKQRVYLNGLFEYADWRSVWKGVNHRTGERNNYFDYYGIESIEIEGLVDGDLLSTKRTVKCDLNNDGMKPLYTISNQVDLTYHVDADNGNYLEYNNLSNTVHTFTLEIPVIVKYIWGEFYTTATVTVDRTPSAKPF